MTNPNPAPDLASHIITLSELDLRHLWCVLSNDVEMQRQLIDSSADAGQATEDMHENAAISQSMIANSRKILQIIDKAFNERGE